MTKNTTSSWASTKWMGTMWGCARLAAVRSSRRNRSRSSLCAASDLALYCVPVRDRRLQLQNLMSADAIHDGNLRRKAIAVERAMMAGGRLAAVDAANSPVLSQQR